MSLVTLASIDGEVAIVIDFNEERHWDDCQMCGQYRRLDHAVPWYCGPTHDEMGSVSTEYRSSDDGPAIVGGMCVCKDCHDKHYPPQHQTEGHQKDEVSP